MPDPASLLGRHAEIAVLDDLLAGLPDRGAAMVVRGEPGVGKSALLDELTRHAAAQGLRVLRTSGVQSEARLPFAGLHQLLRPVLGGVHDLPAPQRAALLAAFGMVDADAPEFFHVALATLELLSDAASATPLLLIADDVQWLDISTRELLTFVGRRLERDPIVLVAAVRRRTGDALADDAVLPELPLGPLAEEHAAALLDAHAPGLAPDLRRRLLDESEGNPLALLELPLALERAGATAPLPSWLPLTTRLEQAFATRHDDLPAPTRDLLLVAALNDGEALAEALEAAALLTGGPVTAEDVTPAVGASLIEIDGTSVRFRHPLVRSAIRQDAGLARRHGAHLALAETLAGTPDRQVWHRAASAMGPDEHVASELVRVATHARRRGAIADSLVALTRAAELTREPTLRAERLLHAADVAFDLGRRDTVMTLLDEVDAHELTPRQHGRMHWLRGLFEEGLRAGPDAVDSAIALAGRMREAGDADRALDSLLTAAWSCYWSNPDRATRDRVVTAADALGVAVDHPKLLATLAFAAPLEQGAVVNDRLARRVIAPGDDPESLRLLCTAAIAVGAFAEAARFYRPAIEELRTQGRLALLARALVSQGWASLHLGGWDAARATVAEAERLAQETAQPRWALSAQLVAAVLAGLRGDDALAEELSAASERELLPTGATSMLALVQMARGTAALAGGRHADAYEHLSRVLDAHDIAHHPFLRAWVLVDVVEAARHVGRLDEARQAAAAIERDAAETNSPLLEMALLCVRPLLAEDGDADRHFRAALDADLTVWPFLRGRTLLSHGAWLRRNRRVADSRMPLRAAREAFEALGAAPWAERARQELRASGETSRSRSAPVTDELTAQELQIGRLVAAGLSNREIGQKLFLSHRTVGSHLYRIFPKLGITSRSEMGRALESAGAAGTTVI